MGSQPPSRPDGADQGNFRMTTRKKVAIIVGSNRKESINRKLAHAMARLAEDSLQFEEIRLDDLPMYNADLEAARPEAVNAFTAKVRGCDAILMVTPEHNRSLPAVLKNAIDWGSKPADANVWRDKPVAIAGTSPGALGTAVAQQHLRQILGSVLGATVMGGEAYITYKAEMIGADGAFADEKTRDFAKAYIDRFTRLVHKLA